MPILLIGFSLIDVFVPVFQWSLTEIPSYVSVDIPKEDYTVAVLYYGLFYVLMLLPLLFLKIKSEVIKNVIYNHRRLLNIGWLFAILSILSFAITVMQNGGIAEWLFNISFSRFNGGLSEEVNTSVLQILPVRTCFNAIVFISFSERKSVKKGTSRVYTFIFPIIALSLSLLTFFRGSILMLILGFVFSEFIRINKLEKAASEIRKMKLRLLKLVFFAILIFGIYGQIREYLIKQRFQDDFVLNEGPSFVFVGHGGHSLAAIINYYKSTNNYLNGNTYIDMLLLPIPRSIYKTKPIWYGIDDITRRMGWPETTQSAVTIPGEAFANFGFLGLFMAFVWGALLFILIKINNKFNGFFWLTPSVFLYIVSTSNWMAFTGFVNQLMLLIMVCCILYVVTDKKRLVFNEKYT